MPKWCAVLFLIIVLSDGATINWNVYEKITKFGETLKLLCEPDECCNETAGWGKWSSGSFQTIILGLKDSVKNKDHKYDGYSEKQGFFLLIRNMSKNDLNVHYSCTYGFQTSPMKLLRKSDIFEEIIETDKNAEDENTDPMIYIAVSLIIIIAVSVALVVMFKMQNKQGILQYCGKRRHGNTVVKCVAYPVPQVDDPPETNIENGRATEVSN